MAVEMYDIDAVKSQLGEILDEFITDIRYFLANLFHQSTKSLNKCSAVVTLRFIALHVCELLSRFLCLTHSQGLPKLPHVGVTKLDKLRRKIRLSEMVS